MLLTVRIEEHLAALERLESESDNQAREAARADVNGDIRRDFRATPGAARAYLLGLRICDPEQALAAMSVVEALAGGEQEEIGILKWYFGEAARQVAECSGSSRASLVLTTYDFLEQHGTGTRKFDLLPLYIELSSSPVVALRRAAVDLLAGFEVASAPGVRDKLLQLLSDGDWDVRRCAEDMLREEGVLPDTYRRPLVDRVRRLLFR